MTRPEIRTYHLPGDERMRYVLSQDRGLIQLKLNSFEAMLEKKLLPDEFDCRAGCLLEVLVVAAAGTWLESPDIPT